MTWLDDLLIDRVFQKIADALCWWRSCYGVAAFLMTGGSAVVLAVAFWHMLHPMDWLGMALWPFGTLWLGAIVRRAYRLDNAWMAGRATLAPDRVTELFTRMFWLFLSMIDWVSVILGISSGLPLIIGDIGWFGMVCGFYFMACTPKRPRTQRRTQLAYVSAR